MSAAFRLMRWQGSLRMPDAADVTAFDSTKDALKHVLSEKKEGDHLYMVGSLYLIGEILEDLKLQLHRDVNSERT